MALLLVTTLSAFSQTKNITVSGRVVEDTKEPAIQATVQLLLLPDSVQASGTATTAQGYFTLPKVSAGKYVLKFPTSDSRASTSLYTFMLRQLPRTWVH